MRSQVLSDWVIPTMNDIAAFLVANGMDDAAEVVLEATVAIQNSSNTLASSRVRTHDSI
jgi:hypothetical protein